MDQASQSQCNSNNGDTKSSVLQESSVLSAPTDLEDDLMSSQRSLSSTRDEIESKSSGISFSSVNIDEFLNSVSSDEFQISSTVNNQELAPNNEIVMAVQISATFPARQGPLCLPNRLSDITIDDVWAEIQQNNNNHAADQENDHGLAFPSFFTSDELLPLQTLGEMTLEDFLIMTGVIRESAEHFPLQQEVLEQSMISYISNGTLGYEFSADRAPNCVGDGNTTLISDGSSVYPMLAAALESTGGGIGEPTNNVEIQLICECPSTNGGTEASSKRKRCAPLDVDIERRKRRMIRNRESAARSRARKQAYTEALEKELKLQREENKRVKLALEEIESKRKQQGNEHVSLAKKKFGAIRRTVSSLW